MLKRGWIHQMESTGSHNDFKNYAIEQFEKLNWKPANPKELSREDLIVYGNIDNDGQGVVCVIDELAKLFKVELERRDDKSVIACKVVKKYTDNTEAKYLLAECLDAVGGLYGDLCCKIGR